MAQLSIIIPVWNLWEMTEACLESIAQVCAKDGLLASMEVIVVDNNSTDATATALEPTLKRLFRHHGHVLRMSENVGFAKACNAGAKKAQNPILFFLNNDTVLTEGCLSPLLEALEKNPKLGIVGPLLLYPDNTVQHAGICFSPNLELEHVHQFLPAPYVKNLKQRFWQAITGAAMLIPAKIFHDCQGFFEGYINGFEDLDLCSIARSQGYVLNVVHKSIIYHHTSQTPGRFDNDAYNAALLSSRCNGQFRPDIHNIALELGLRPLLSPDQELYIGISEAKEYALKQVFTENFDVERCKKQLENEPYWIGGYNLLANHFEKQKMWLEAIDMYLQATRLAPLKAHFANLAVCAAHAGKQDILADAQKRLQNCINKTKDIQKLWKNAQKIRAWATQNNDPELDRLFAQWQQKHPQHDGENS